jgi:hypothetical protein
MESGLNPDQPLASGLVAMKTPSTLADAGEVARA